MIYLDLISSQFANFTSMFECVSEKIYVYFVSFLIFSDVSLLAGSGRKGGRYVDNEASGEKK